MYYGCLTAGAYLRNTYARSFALSVDHSHDDYLNSLINKGVTLNPKIFPAVFALKNGLPYVGIAARYPISEDEVLIRIPYTLVLSSVQALYYKSLKYVYSDYFLRNDASGWYDRVIIIYCLYLLQQRDENNVWYQMVNRFPKECDIGCFWDYKDLNCFKDLTVKKAASIDFECFYEEWAEFEACQKRHQILQTESFIKDNYRRIFINLTNRSFGKTLQYVSLVPFAYLFNHHCSNVYYATEYEKFDHFYNYYEVREYENIYENYSSEGSHKSDQYLYEDYFDYFSVGIVPYLWSNELDENLNKNEMRKIEQLTTKCLQSICEYLSWQYFSILFAGGLIEKVKVVTNEYNLGRRRYQRAMTDLYEVLTSVKKYRVYIYEYYEQVKGKKYETKPEYPIQPHKVPTELPKYKQSYQSFVIKTGQHDFFSANYQIYFCYGHNSNRALLLHYGFAILGNKYERVWISCDIRDYLKRMPDTMEIVMRKGLSLLRKFNIKHLQLCMDIIMFIRLKQWTYYGYKSIKYLFRVYNMRKYLTVIQYVRQIIENHLQKIYSHYDLTNKSLGYHYYFAAVYNTEQINILTQQINLLSRIYTILKMIDQGISKYQATASLIMREKLLLKKYLRWLE